MLTTAPHIIHKQHIELHLMSPEQAHGWEQRVYHFCRDRMPSLLEEVFSAVVDDDTVLRLDEFHLDLGLISVQEIEEEWEEKIKEKLRKCLDQSSPQVLYPMVMSRFLKKRGKVRFCVHHKLKNHFSSWIYIH